MQKRSITYNKPFVEFIKIHVDDMLKMFPKRLKHIKRVVKRAKKLAEIYQVNTYEVQVAAYLHDITKKWSNKKHIEYLESDEALKYKKHLYYLHAASGAKYAKEVLNIENQNILDAIYFHSTGSDNMSQLAKIIIVADMCEPKRKHWDPNKLFEVAKIDLDHALAQSLHIKMQHFIETKTEPHENLKRAYDYYKENIWTK